MSYTLTLQQREPIGIELAVKLAYVSPPLAIPKLMGAWGRVLKSTQIKK
jgi:hypothetical protein